MPPGDQKWFTAVPGSRQLRMIVLVVYKRLAAAVHAVASSTICRHDSCTIHTANADLIDAFHEKSPVNFGPQTKKLYGLLLTHPNGLFREAIFRH